VFVKAFGLLRLSLSPAVPLPSLPPSHAVAYANPASQDANESLGTLTGQDEEIQSWLKLNSPYF